MEEKRSADLQKLPLLKNLILQKLTKCNQNSTTIITILTLQITVKREITFLLYANFCLRKATLLHMYSCTCQPGSQVIRAFSDVEKPFIFLFGNFQPPNQKTKKGFSTSEISSRLNKFLLYARLKNGRIMLYPSVPSIRL